MPQRPCGQNHTPRRPWGQQGPAFEAFEKELFSDVIPHVESHYAVESGRADSAAAGLSMGGRQSLNIGLRNLDAFAWVGEFSAAPNTKPAAELTPQRLAADQLLVMVNAIYLKASWAEESAASSCSAFSIVPAGPACSWGGSRSRVSHAELRQRILATPPSVR